MDALNGYKLPRGKVLCLRTCNADLTSHGGFQWKPKGFVECSDWSEVRDCGNGLHGLLWGSGDGSLLNWSEEAKWLVVEVSAKLIIDLAGKVKFPKCKVVYCGGRDTATAMVSALAPQGTLIVGLTATAGDGGTATAGDRGTATAGYGGTATAGYRGTATAGDGGVISIRHWDDSASRYRIVLLYPGENGIQPNMKYQLDRNGKPVEIKD